MLNRHIVGLKLILLGHGNRWTQCNHHELSCGVHSSWEGRKTPSVSPLPFSPLWSKPRMMEFLIVMPRLSRQLLCLWFHFDFMVHANLLCRTMIVILICSTFCASQLDKKCKILWWFPANINSAKKMSWPSVLILKHFLFLMFMKI